MMSTLKKDVLLIGAGRVATVLLTLISIRTVTSFLSPDQYGELAILVTIQMLCGLLMMNPLTQHLSLHTHQWWDDGTLTRRLKSYNRYVFIASLLGALFSLLLRNFGSVSEGIILMSVVFMVVAATTWNTMLIPLLNMLGFRSASVAWSIITALVSLIVAVCFVSYSPSAISWYAGQAVGMLIGGVGAQFYFRKQLDQNILENSCLPIIDREAIKNYCMPLAIATGFMWVQLSGYRFAIEYYWGLAQLGLFAVGMQLSGQVWALIESLSTQLLYPFFFRRVSDYSKSPELRLATSDLLNTLGPIYIILAGITILAAPYLVKLLVSSQYEDAAKFVVIGAVVELCRVLGNVLSNIAHAKRETKALTLPYALGALGIFVSISAFGICGFEFEWVGFALIIGALAMLCTMTVMMYRKVNFRLHVGRFVFSVSAFFCMSGSSGFMPSSSSLTLTLTIFVLLAISVLAIFQIFLVSWNNPAALRLLSVKLRNK